MELTPGTWNVQVLKFNPRNAIELLAQMMLQ